MPVAFAVRKDYENIWEPGVIAVGDSTVHLGELLAEGDGQIVVADDQNLLRSRLEEQPALKHVPVHTAEEKARAAALRTARETYQAQPVKELRPLLEQRGIDMPQSATKAHVVDALVAHDDANWTPEPEGVS